MLPSTPGEFRTQGFWRSFFSERAGKPFDWYAHLSDFLPEFRAAVPISKPFPRILIPGCGNSTLSEELWRAGYSDVVSTDFDAGVIDEMREKTARSFPGLRWEVADSTALDETRFPKEAFAAVLDKGLLDALLPHSDNDEALEQRALEDARLYLGHAARILSRGSGALVIVTLAQTHVLELLLKDAALSGIWRCAAIYPLQADSPMCAFLVVLKRAETPWAIDLRRTTAPLAVTIRGLSRADNEATSSVLILDGSQKSMDAVHSAVADIKWAFATRRALRTIGDAYVVLDLWLTNNASLLVAPRGTSASALGRDPVESPAYSIAVVDARMLAVPRLNPPRVAVLIVPAGREHEWSFGSPEGQRELASSANVERLIVVALGSGATNAQRFKRLSPSEIQAELSPIILTMLPDAISAAADNIPYLSVAADLGERSVVAEGDTSLSGRYFVEDVATEDGVFRRLVFLSNRAALQTEMRMKDGKPDQTGPLCFSYHRLIVKAVDNLGAGLGGAATSRARVLTIGLGGGALPSFMSSSFSSWAAVSAIELDEGIADVAEQYFCLTSSKRVKVGSEDADAAAFGQAFEESSPSPGTVGIIIGDGLRVIELLAHPACRMTSKPSIIIVDVNAGASELASGLSFPPQAFLTPTFLNQVRAALAPSGGTLIINLGARSPEKCAEATAAVKKAFSSGYAAVIRSTEEDDDDDGGELNCIIIAGESQALASSLINTMNGKLI